MWICGWVIAGDCLAFQDLYIGVGGQHIYLEKFSLTSVLVTFERTTTFSQLSHDGRTAVERDKNARKIVG